MHVSTRQHYPTDPESLHALLSNEDFLRDAAAEMGAVSSRVAASSTRSAVEATLESPTEVRAFMGPTLTLMQETTWQDARADGSRTGTMTITLSGAPASMTASLDLTPEEAGCCLTYEGDLTVRVPVLGPTIEKAASPLVDKALAAQERVAQRWLST